ncbi:hypothetical protein JRQ81_013432 [Phrynocephalus forsythii]|uniref:Insulin-like domain-containing protein n=1 Tax=Phrynocephalus forsythii TaxID=171643 RepID=A0A9Q1B4R4_9SAUR|nr:hypothetical protein JRQ81_013432 [Phrynocephalus forsythii]
MGLPGRYKARQGMAGSSAPPLRPPRALGERLGHAMGPQKLLLGLLLAVTLPAERSCQSAPERLEEAAAAGGRLESPGGGEYGVRLCGREFIRAVIFTCGGSRWKRISAPPAEFVQTGSDNGLENINLQSVLDPKLDQLRTIISQSAQEQSLKNMFNFYDDDNEYVPTSDSFNEYIRQAKDVMPKSREELRLATSMGSNYFPWEKYPRRKRDFSVGVAAMCCKWGCTKTEISTLC